MTENHWASASTPGNHDHSGQASPAVNLETSGTSASKKDVAKEEVTQVAGQAATAVQGVAQTAKSEAANVAAEATSSAKELFDQAKQGLSTQAGTQQQKAAEGIRTISSQLQNMADAPEQQGIASDLIRQAAQRSESVASWLENKEPGDMLDEVQRFARTRPGTFLLLAASAGVLAGRLTKALTASTTSPQTPGQALSSQQPATARHAAPLQQETAFAAGTGATLYDDPPVVTGAPVSTTPLPSGTADDLPLRFEDDPYQSTKGRPL